MPEARKYQRVPSLSGTPCYGRSSIRVVGRPPAASRCARMRSLRPQARETVHGKAYLYWDGYVKKHFPVARCGRDRAAVAAPEATAGQVLGFFAKLLPLKNGIKACGVAYHWASQFRALGHEVVLPLPQYVKPYLRSWASCHVQDVDFGHQGWLWPFGLRMFGLEARALHHGTWSPCDPPETAAAKARRVQ